MARAAQRLTRLIVATLTMLLGVVMLVLPGPGLLTLALGLGLMGRELQWQWVLRAERRLRTWTSDLADRSARLRLKMRR
jgi:hypothetical protein